MSWQYRNYFEIVVLIRISDNMKKLLVLNWRSEIHDIITQSGNSAVYVLDKKYLYTDYQRCVDECIEKDADYIIVENLSDINTVFSLISYIRSKGDFDDVLSCDETTQFAASVLLRDVFSNDAEARIYASTRDKRLMKLELEPHVSMARWFSVIDYCERGRISSLPEGFNFPIVLKPVNRFLSAETYKIHDLTQLNDALDKNKLNLCDFIGEEFISGDEFEVDVIWCEGKVRHIYIAKYQVTRLHGYNNRIPRITTYLPYTGHEELYDRLEAECKASASVLEIRSGVTHAEFFVNDDKVVLGEIAFRHPGGAGNKTLSLATGEGLLEMGLRARLGWHEGETSEKYIDGFYIGNIDARPHSSGIVESVTPKDKILSLPGVLDVIYRIRLNHYIEAFGRESWCALAVIKSDNIDDLITKLRNVQDNFEVEFKEEISV